MDYSIQNTLKDILKKLDGSTLKHQHFIADSGCCMIDIFKPNKVHVIQLEHDSIGLSELEIDEWDLSTIPDERFYNMDDFQRKFDKIIMPWL